MSWGLLFDQNDHERIIHDDNVVMTCRHYFTLPWDPRATDGSTWPEGGAMLIRLGKFDYLLAGSGVVIDFKTPTEKQQEQQKTLGEDGFAEAGGEGSKFKVQGLKFDIRRGRLCRGWRRRFKVQGSRIKVQWKTPWYPFCR